MSPDAVFVFAILLLGAITFCYRFSFVNSQGRKLADRIPPAFLKMLAPATFSAIIVNNLLSAQAHPEEFQKKILVSLFALGVAYKTKSIVATLLFGLLALGFLQRWMNL